MVIKHHLFSSCIAGKEIGFPSEKKSADLQLCNSWYGVVNLRNTSRFHGQPETNVRSRTIFTHLPCGAAAVCVWVAAAVVYEIYQQNESATNRSLNRSESTKATKNEWTHYKNGFLTVECRTITHILRVFTTLATRFAYCLVVRVWVFVKYSCHDGRLSNQHTHSREGHIRRKKNTQHPKQPYDIKHGLHTTNTIPFQKAKP